MDIQEQDQQQQDQRQAENQQPGRRGSLMRTALRHRRFRRLMTGLAASQAGDWVYNVALLAYVYDRTHSTTLLGVTTAARVLPVVVLGPLGGVLADRFDRRRLMIAADVLRAALMLVLAAAVALGLPVLVVPALAALATAAGAAYPSCTAAAVARLVPDTDLPGANAVRSLVGPVCIVVGPSVGALLLGVAGAGLAFALNALTFLLSAAAVGSIPADTAFRATARTPQAAPRIHRELAEGLAALLSHRSALRLVGADVLASFVYGVLTVVLVLVSDHVGAGASGYGLLLAACGVGGVLGAVLAGRLAAKAPSRRVLSVALVVVAGPLPLLAVSPWLALALVWAALGGAGATVVEVLAEVALQRELDDAVLGRAYGFAFPASIGGICVGAAVAPVLVGTVGLTAALGLVAALVAGCATWLAGPTRRRVTGSLVTLTAGAVVVGTLALEVSTAAPAAAAPAVVTSLSYAPAYQTYTVPAGVTSLHLDVIGGSGSSGGGPHGGAGAPGGEVVGDVAVTPGQVLRVWVGGAGQPGGDFGYGSPGHRDFSGGAGGATVGSPGQVGGGGGAASYVQAGVHLVALGGGGGGGGGAGEGYLLPGGAGGAGGSYWGADRLGYVGEPGHDGADLDGGGQHGGPNIGSSHGGAGTDSDNLGGGGGGGGGGAGPVDCSGPDCVGAGGGGHADAEGGGGGGAGGSSYTAQELTNARRRLSPFGVGAAGRVVISHDRTDSTTAVLDTTGRSGEPVTLRAVVSPVDGGGPVQFIRDDGFFIDGCETVPLTSGGGDTYSASCTTTLDPGVHAVRADYLGDSSFGPSAGTGSVTVTPPPAVTTSALPGGTVGASYAGTLEASGGTPPYTWYLDSGSLPQGLTLHPYGPVDGTPSAPGAWTFQARVVDAAGQSATGPVTVGVEAAPVGHPDLGVSLVRGGPLVHGRSGTSSVRVIDSGTAATTATTTARVVLSAGLTLTKAAGSGWVCRQAGQVVTCRHSAPLAATVPSTVSLTVRVDAAAGATARTSVVVTPTDGTPGDNTALDQVRVR